MADLQTIRTADRDDGEALRTLLAEREIERVLATYARAIDRCDAELLRSCYHDDARDDHGGVYVGSAHGYVDWVMDHLRQHFLQTMHTLHNVLVDVDGDAARAESVCVAHHVRAGAGDRLIMDVFACRYLDEFDTRPGAGWRIANRVVVREWRLRQDMLSYAEQPAGFLAGSRDRTDLVYAPSLPRRTDADQPA